ncbi:hypothetical protein RCL_jg13914.t1 [Rhizophagus clarus]|uniref:Uncharacterized protein n=1 Tax=Rhizophagus clarus TaxID=94130 RepID=A0A8H3QSZ5_9GLOM|nr:hypothetical protein RCL_jg13914.t1 [Rhizophagus clarus]
MFKSTYYPNSSALPTRFKLGLHYAIIASASWKQKEKLAETLSYRVRLMRKILFITINIFHFGFLIRRFRKILQKLEKKKLSSINFTHYYDGFKITIKQESSNKRTSKIGRIYKKLAHGESRSHNIGIRFLIS